MSSSIPNRLKPFIDKHCFLTLSDSTLQLAKSLELKPLGNKLRLFIFDWDKCDAETQGIICEEAGQDDYPMLAVVNSANREEDEIEVLLESKNSGFLMYSGETIYLGDGEMEKLMDADEFFAGLAERHDSSDDSDLSDEDEEEEEEEGDDDEDSDEDADDDSDDEEEGSGKGGEPQWLKITKETDWKSISKDERWEKVKKIAQGMRWRDYDWKSSPAANFDYPDFTAEQMEHLPPWMPKHHNEVGSMETCHVPDLNQIGSGAERKMMAVYGIPVEWPRKKDEPDRLNEFLDTLDAARAKGGEEWTKALDDHGLLNDEHYVWLRYDRLGVPKKMANNPNVQRIVREIDSAIAEGNGKEIFAEYELRDQLHYDGFKAQFAKLKQKLDAEQAAQLLKVQAGMAQQFEQNKAALTGELAPFMGISLEDWARSNAKIIKGTPVGDVIAGLKIEKSVWDQVNTEWNARMARDKTFTVATVYGKAFTGGI